MCCGSDSNNNNSHLLSMLALNFPVYVTKSECVHMSFEIDILARNSVLISSGCAKKLVQCCESNCFQFRQINFVNYVKFDSTRLSFSIQQFGVKAMSPFPNRKPSFRWTVTHLNCKKVVENYPSAFLRWLTWHRNALECYGSDVRIWGQTLNFSIKGDWRERSEH